MPLPTPPVDLNKPLPPLPLRAMPSDMARLEDPKYRAYQPLPPSQQQGPASYPRSRRNGMLLEQSDIDALNAALQDEPPHPQIRRKQVGSSGQPGAPKNRELEDHIAAGGLGEAAVHASFFHHRSEGDGQTSVAHGSSASRAPRPNERGQTLHQDELPACLRTGTAKPPLSMSLNPPAPAQLKLQHGLDLLQCLYIFRPRQRLAPFGRFNLPQCIVLSQRLVLPQRLISLSYFTLIRRLALKSPPSLD
ncbi:hypothetical protein IQ07DRAFT_606072 [Pyrenochaeta sp. DS3sAY3a]|nr:hypothetical protein IQ07DRAFT_606072 [Pyrenochaeta sp. DS3sAY3a]